jgi:hypothetical protein
MVKNKNKLKKEQGVRGVSPRIKKSITLMLSLIGETIISFKEREGSCRGLRARHEVSSLPPGKNRGLTRCIDTEYKADVTWHPNHTE